MSNEAEMLEDLEGDDSLEAAECRRKARMNKMLSSLPARDALPARNALWCGSDASSRDTNHGRKRAAYSEALDRAPVVSRAPRWAWPMTANRDGGSSRGRRPQSQTTGNP